MLYNLILLLHTVYTVHTLKYKNNTQRQTNSVKVLQVIGVLVLGVIDSMWGNKLLYNLTRCRMQNKEYYVVL